MLNCITLANCADVQKAFKRVHEHADVQKPFKRVHEHAAETA